MSRGSDIIDMPPQRAVVIADDITGANDTGNQFAIRGYRTHVAVADSASHPTDVLVVDTETRGSLPDDAYDKVEAVVRASDTPVIYKKLDSTLRGNIAAELGAVLDEADLDILVVAPAFPGNERTTEDGVQLVDGRPVCETMDGNENLPSTSNVIALLSTLSYPVKSLPLGVVAEGAAAVRERLSEFRTETSTPVVVVSDATTSDHLRSLAVAARSLHVNVAYAGSGGLASVLPLQGSDPDSGGILAVVGSISQTAMAQLDYLDTESIVSLNSSRAIAEPEAAADDALEAVVKTQREHGYAVLASAKTETDVSNTLEAAVRLGLDEDVVNRRIATALSGTTRRLNDARPLDGLFTTGGSVTSAVLDELNASRLELTGQEIADGIPLARIRGGSAADTPLVTKAGSFGDTTTIANCLDFLEMR